MLKNKNIEEYYTNYDEDSRLLRVRGIIEFERTKQIILKYVKQKALNILDIGGATGHYSFWLAELGHTVTLIEPVKKHIEKAKRKNKNNQINIIHQSIESVDFHTQQFDVILNFGPLYHILEKENRLKVIRKMKDILKPSGVLFISLVSRFASLIDGYVKDFIKDPEYQEIIENELKDGKHYPGSSGKYFTDAYLYHPEEIKKELTETGFKKIKTHALESFAWLLKNYEEIVNDKKSKTILYKFFDMIDQEESLMGVSAHFLVKCEI